MFSPGLSAAGFPSGDVQENDLGPGQGFLLPPSCGSHWPRVAFEHVYGAGGTALLV